MPARFKRRLLSGYLTSFLLLVIAIAASFISIQKMSSSSEWVNHTYKVLGQLNDVYLDLKEAESAERKYANIQNTGDYHEFSQAAMEASADIQTVSSLTVDNIEQQNDAANLRDAADSALAAMQGIIALKEPETAQAYVQNLNARSSHFISEAHRIIDRMKAREETLMQTRTGKLDFFSSITPWLLAISTLVAIAIAIYSLIRVISDFRERVRLQNQLQTKDAEVTRRIHAIEHIANQISSGNYAVRVGDQNKDVLGALAADLDQMASSLQSNFEQLRHNDWMQAGVSRMQDVAAGAKKTSELGRDVLQELSVYANISTGVLFIENGNGRLELLSVIGLGAAQTPGPELHTIQLALARRDYVLLQPGEDSQAIRFTIGSIQPGTVITVPLLMQQELIGVMELSFVRRLLAFEIDYILNIARRIALAIRLSTNHEQVQQLLEETQSQSEELQAQHRELEIFNSNLEAQTLRLQSSEEELRVQQEELMQANQEVRARSEQLEEQNKLVQTQKDELTVKAAELEESNRYKSEFLANMSHELRTPLNSILLLARLLSDNKTKNLSEEQVKYAEVIQNSGKNLLTLIDDILDMSKMDAGRMEVEWSDVPVDAVLGNLSELFKPMALERGIVFETDKDPGLPLYFRSDQTKLEQVLRNLLFNSIKFTHEGYVKLRVAKIPNGLAFQVIDTGIGIPEDKQDQIFEAFMQADGSTRRKYGGTGLGLSISKKLANLLGGDLSLQSSVNQGSVFTLSLPLFTDEKLQQEAVGTSAPIAETLLGTPDDDRLLYQTSSTVWLIADKDPSIGMTLRDLAHAHGALAILCNKGSEVITLAERFRPRLILMDEHLQKQSGWEALMQLKQHPELRAIPVILFADAGEKLQALAKGAARSFPSASLAEDMEPLRKAIEELTEPRQRTVVIMEEEQRHAEALSLFLSSQQVKTSTITDEANWIAQVRAADVLILELSALETLAYERLERLSSGKDAVETPVILFTNKTLSKLDDERIQGFSKKLVLRQAGTYQQVLENLTLWLHLPVKGTLDEEKDSDVLHDRHVMVVDDDVRNIFSLSKVLEEQKMHVYSAVDGREAFERLQANPQIEIILMDIMMPEIDGLETIRRIRAEFSGRNLPIIAVTARVMAGSREESIAAGASDYIFKPVDTDQLLSLLRVWLYHSR